MHDVSFIRLKTNIKEIYNLEQIKLKIWKSSQNSCKVEKQLKSVAFPYVWIKKKYTKKVYIYSFIGKNNFYSENWFKL